MLYRRVDFIADFTYESHPHQPTRHVSDHGLAQSEIRKCRIAQVKSGQLTQDRPRARAGDVEPRVVPGQIDEADPEAPPGCESAELAKQGRGISSRGREVERLRTQSADDAIVDDDARLIEH